MIDYNKTPVERVKPVSIKRTLEKRTQKRKISKENLIFLKNIGLIK